MIYPQALLAVIAAPDASAKAALLAGLEPPPDGATWVMPALPLRPGRPPEYHEVVAAPKRRRTLRHEPTRMRFLLALHHIELSAIDLACVAALAGSGMPQAFHADQLAVAREEAAHAGLVGALLLARGWPPGSEGVHYRLWDATRACADLGELLVVVPRFLEARGLDVAAVVLPRLAEIDAAAHAVVARIYADEQGHVGIGTRWHRAWCVGRGLDPEAHFQTIATAHFPDQIPGPFALDVVGRERAGFTTGELAFLAGPGVSPSPRDAYRAPSSPSGGAP